MIPFVSELEAFVPPVLSKAFPGGNLTLYERARSLNQCADRTGLVSIACRSPAAHRSFERNLMESGKVPVTEILLVET